jgi:cytochrome c biogenesis protein CcdA/thiol-disulfide isomerase/thioredoxin
MILLLIFSCIAGILTVLSPCVLPILPILLAVSIGQGRYRPLGIIIGLVLSFAFFTLAITSLVNLLGISPNFLRYAAIAFIAFFGLTMLSERLNSTLSFITSRVAQVGTVIQEKSQAAGQGFLSGFIFGIALGLIWTPCAGPILATIATLVATGSITVQTVIITLAYSIGTGIPLFLIAYGGNKILGALPTVSTYSELIRKLFGIVLILSAFAIAFHADVILQQFTLNYFPALRIETNKTVEKELEALKVKRTQPLAQGGQAPEFAGIAEWINTPPLTLEQLRGKVVLVDFWTYSCINCVRTLPYLKHWYDTYKDKGLVIVGVHTPEFEFEKASSNVKDAVKRFGISYPVALDNKYATWLRYDNHYWPAHYLVDQQGIIREMHFGEGAYLETENALRALLNLPPLTKEEKREEKRAAHNLTPESYLGYARAISYTPEISITKDQIASYNYRHALAPDHIGLKGSWLVAPESIQANSDDARLTLNFMAGHVYLVMESSQPQTVELMLDEKPLPSTYQTVDMKSSGQIKVHEARMYTLLDLDHNERHLITLKVPQGVSLYVFTFGP